MVNLVVGNRIREKIIKHNLQCNNVLESLIPYCNLGNIVAEYKRDKRPIDLYSINPYFEFMGELAVDKSLTEFMSEIQHVFKIIGDSAVIAVIFGNSKKYEKIEKEVTELLNASLKNIEVYFLKIEIETIEEFSELNKLPLYYAMQVAKKLDLKADIRIHKIISNNRRYFENLKFIGGLSLYGRDIPISFIHKKNKTLNYKFLCYGGGAEHVEFQVCPEKRIIKYCFNKYTYHLFKTIANDEIYIDNFFIKIKEGKRRQRHAVVIEPTSKEGMPLEIFMKSVVLAYTMLIRYTNKSYT